MPALLMATPAAPLPACSVAITLGAVCVALGDAEPLQEARASAASMSITVSLSSGMVLVAIGGIDLHRAGDQHDVLLGRHRHVARRPDHAVGHIDLGQHLGRGGAQVDEGDGVGGGLGTTSILPLTSLTLASLADTASCACAAAGAAGDEQQQPKTAAAAKPLMRSTCHRFCRYRGREPSTQAGAPCETDGP